eukprot:TRINITY_DN5759_c1_g1_i4.p2 TRINITY_DN5759_c1_g1~~TRINITY_DN5759_c1_g1_i4.p2  ORF type:complete len:218 (+),score=15.31 TRINITY_DN5759_c1_g1_i4:178-831(+)
MQRSVLQTSSIKIFNQFPSNYSRHTIRSIRRIIKYCNQQNQNIQTERGKFYRSTVLIRRQGGRGQTQRGQWYESSVDELVGQSGSELGEIGGIQFQSPEILTNIYSKVQQRWNEVPNRWKIVYTITLSFVLCNMDKVNMSIAVIPMAKEFGWTSSLIGLVTGFFFYGYMLAQYPGGLIARKFGGQRVLPVGVGLWSLSTVAVPLLAGAIPTLVLYQT